MGSLAVIVDDRLVGIVTDRDLVRRGIAKDLAPPAAVEKVTSSPVFTIDADADLHSAFALFRSNAVRRLAVVDGYEFAGMITVDDLLVDLAADLADLARPIAAEIFLPVDEADQPESAQDGDDEWYGDRSVRRCQISGPSDRMGLFVSDDLITITPDATVRQLATRLAAEGVGALVVNDGDRILGIVSERDVVFPIAAGRDLDSTTVAGLENRDVVTCTPDTTVHAAAVRMLERYVRHMLVEDLTGRRAWSRPGASSERTQPDSPLGAPVDRAASSGTADN
jgi:CBS domain-containing protein